MFKRTNVGSERGGGLAPVRSQRGAPTRPVLLKSHLAHAHRLDAAVPPVFIVNAALRLRRLLLPPPTPSCPPSCPCTTASWARPTR